MPDQDRCEIINAQKCRHLALHGGKGGVGAGPPVINGTLAGTVCGMLTDSLYNSIVILIHCYQLTATTNNTSAKHYVTLLSTQRNIYYQNNDTLLSCQMYEIY